MKGFNKPLYFISISLIVTVVVIISIKVTYWEITNRLPGNYYIQPGNYLYTFFYLLDQEIPKPKSERNTKKVERSISPLLKECLLTEHNLAAKKLGYSLCAEIENIKRASKEELAIFIFNIFSEKSEYNPQEEEDQLSVKIHETKKQDKVISLMELRDQENKVIARMTWTFDISNNNFQLECIEGLNIVLLEFIKRTNLSLLKAWKKDSSQFDNSITID